ncbi:TonB-dependent receptor [Altericroceibacterium endophyticum]|uniref:TonB-dependent receptor n=1 Tax=Altericroceibacterium endophyticum TaxID=1808508 RepID=A0A6I4T251_9SPHN|nr:TonB-dependent receptor [Altericroceibacterium endophyticum]MXO64173.1 TonB-dependent receptor [Altericroceibacterium endophyticum]
MRSLPLVSLSALIAGLLAVPAQAQDVSFDESADSLADNGEIVVVAESMRGQVDAPQPPLLVLDTKDIAAYGVGSLQELMEVLSPQTGSSRGGPPAFLVNGMRISSFRELRSYPPEAIEKVEILPEEVAQRYGFAPDRRVVNFILKKNYSSREIELEYGQPDQGGYSEKEVELTFLKLDGPNRLNINAEFNDSSMLTEAERNIVQAQTSLSDIPSDPSQAPYRSLVNDSNEVEVTANWSRKLGDAGSSLSVNGTYELSDNRSLQGLNSVRLTDPDGQSVLRNFGAADPLEKNRRNDTYSLGSTLNVPVDEWEVTATLDASLAKSRTETDRNADTAALEAAALAGEFALDGAITADTSNGYDTARSKVYSLGSLVTAMGRPLLLPAGEVSVTLDAGYSWDRIQSRDIALLSEDSVQLTRGDLSAGANIAIPIASRREDHWSALGDVTLNLAGGVNELSDFGTLTDWSAGVNWGLTESLNLSATYIAEDAAPSLSQLGDPQVVTNNVQLYDLRNEETVLAQVTSGGNPALPKQSQRDWKISLNWDLPIMERASINLDYINSHTDDVTASFPTLTPSIEAAFPDRVTRDETGRLIALDQRAVTFAQQKQQRIKLGINLGGSFGENDDAAGGGRPGGRGRPGGGGPPPRGGAADKAGAGRSDGAPGKQGANAAAGENGRQSSENQSANAQSGGSEANGQQSEGKRPERSEGRRSGGGRRGGGGMGGRPSGGRWFLNLTQTIELNNTILISENGPQLDLLEGDALSAGGNPRYSAALRGGVFYKGYGLFTSGKFSGKSHVSGTVSDLYFDDLVTFDIRLFADLGQREKLVEKAPIFENTRISLKIDNVFDARQRVTNGEGEVPLRYQPDLVDPTGRFIGVQLRKLF